MFSTAIIALSVAVSLQVPGNLSATAVSPAKIVSEPSMEPIVIDVKIDTSPFETKDVPEAPVEEEVIPDKELWFSDDYYDINLAIKDYASEYASIDMHGIHIDGLAVMAQANTESKGMVDPSKTLTALYPSVFVDINSIEDIYNLDVTEVWGNPDALNGTYRDMPFWSYKAGPYYAWTPDDGIYEQGPLQTRVTPNSLKYLEGAKSEYNKLEEAGLLNVVGDTTYGYSVLNYCTGSEYLNTSLEYETYGDRWSIKDNCLIWKAQKEAALDSLWNSYYSTCGYTPSTEEVLAVLSYAHWVPEVIKGNTSLETVQYYGFSYQDAWFDITHQLASEEGLDIIRQHVKANIDANRARHYDSYYSKEQATQILSLALSAGSTSNASDSEPWQIFNELVDKGIVDPSTVIIHPDYGYQHAMKYAIQYLYAYIMLEELLINQY